MARVAKRDKRAEVFSVKNVFVIVVMMNAGGFSSAQCAFKTVAKQNDIPDDKPERRLQIVFVSQRRQFEKLVWICLIEMLVLAMYFSKKITDGSTQHYIGKRLWVVPEASGSGLNWTGCLKFGL